LIQASCRSQQRPDQITPAHQRILFNIVPQIPTDLDFLFEGKQPLSPGLLGHISFCDRLDNKLSAFINEDDATRAIIIWINAFDHQPVERIKKIKLYLSQYISLLDQMINEQINLILHHEKFQQLESGWRGISQLVATASNYSKIKIRILDVSWKEISKDIDRAADFDHSALFNLIYNQEFGIAGGEPFGVLLGDYQVSHRPSTQHPNDDVSTLRGLAQIAAAAFAPFICGGSPELFGLDQFETLGNPINFDSIFRQQEYLSWRSLRETEDSRFLAIALPQVLMRKPYQNKILNGNALLFNEDVNYKNSSRYLWGNACYAMGVVLLREFGDVGWFSHIRGAPRDHIGGGLVTDFPCIDFGTDSAGVAQNTMTDVIISDSKEQMLSDHGFLALCDCYDTPFASFQGCPSIHKPKQYDSKSVTANARMAAMLQQILCASRFAHYIKVMIRDKVGSFTSDIECERLLQNWLNQYTTGRDDLDWDALSRYPLQSARVKVRELPGKPGVYNSVIHLKPHYIVDQLVSELKLTTELSQSGFGVL